MPFTPNKGLSVQAAASNPGVWGAGNQGQDLNTGVMGILDNNLGGIATVPLSASPVPLSATQSQMCILRFTGTLLAGVTVTTACIGFTIIENLCTLGSFSVTFTNGVSGVVVPAGRSIVISDSTNGCRIAATDSFPTGTRTAFNQSFAPTGWTKDLTVDNAAIRLSSTGGGTGGTANFTDAFANRTILQANIPNYNLPYTDPGHLHVTTIRVTGSAGGGSNPAVGGGSVGTNDYPSQAAFTGITINSGGSGTPMNFAVKYYDFCLAVKA